MYDQEYGTIRNNESDTKIFITYNEMKISNDDNSSIKKKKTNPENNVLYIYRTGEQNNLGLQYFDFLKKA